MKDYKNTHKCVRGGSLDISGWHRLAKEVLLPHGICTCVTTQSNNLLQKVIVYDSKNFNKR